MDLSVVIVSYNVKFYLEQALRSIQKALEEIESEIIVVDNGSGDGSDRLVKELEGRPEGFVEDGQLVALGSDTKPYMPGYEKGSTL